MNKRFGVLLGLLAALAGGLAACGGRAGGGALTVAISGLPAGVNAAVSVAGPSGFSRTLTETQTLSGLAAGSYTVTAGAVPNYSAQVSGSPAQVTAGQTASVSVVYSAAAAGSSISGTVSLAGSTAADVPFVPGEVIVKFKTGLNAQALKGLGGLERLRDLPLDGVGLYRSAGLSAQSAAARAQTLNLVAALAAREDVLYAHPNYLLEAYATPNDPNYGLQWHYPAINLPAAWDRTTGSSGVAVAVLDSGILAEHPDLNSKLSPGYDFVSNVSISGDGDGRDGDPADPDGTSAYHGAHVAGTVAAATNNGVGVAGVSWGARILPVRVLGIGNGALADAIDGILWSVGEAVPGVPNNPNPADVLNLSLGGPYSCGEVPALQDALDLANEAGVAVVVAAGNENVDANGVTPASCGGVVTVGATNLSGQRAAYSNYGSRIDVMAPGGDLTQDADGNGRADGVLSTVRDDATGDYTYGYLDGTSMASPHVAGAIALLKSVRPELSGAEARDILIATARPITGGSCSAGCGAGLIDVAAALAALSQPVTPDFSLSLSPAALNLNAGTSADIAVTLSRSGGFDDTVSFSVSGLPGGLSASFTPPSTPGDSAVLNLSATAALSGSYVLEVQATGGGLSRTRTLGLEVIPEEEPGGGLDVQGAYVVACPTTQTTCVIDALPNVQIGTGGTSAPYTISNVPAGSYFVSAWKDLNGNGRVDNGEPFGTYPALQEPQPVSPPANGIDVVMSPALGTQMQKLNRR